MRSAPQQDAELDDTTASGACAPSNTPVPVVGPPSFALSGEGHVTTVVRFSLEVLSSRPRRLNHRELLDELDTQMPESDDAWASGLSVRDVCKVDPQFSALLQPCIFIRGSTLLVSLGSQRLGAILMADQLYLLVPESRSPMVELVQRKLRQLLRPQGRSSGMTPAFQVSAFEAVLHSASSEIQSNTKHLVVTVKGEVASAHEDALFEDAEQGSAWIVGARELRNRVHSLMETARGIDAALAQCLEDDEILRLVQRDIEASASQHAGSERMTTRRHRDAAALLIEFYLGQIRRSSSQLSNAAQSLTGHEKFATLLLDHARNRLLKFEVVITGSSAAIGLGAMVASIFGMNMPASIFDSGSGYGPNAPHWLFPAVAVGVGIIAFLFIAALVFGLYCWPRYKRRRAMLARSTPITGRATAAGDGWRDGVSSPTSGVDSGDTDYGGRAAPKGLSARDKGRTVSRVQNLREMLLRPESFRGRALRSIRGTMRGTTNNAALLQSRNCISERELTESR